MLIAYRNDARDQILYQTARAARCSELENNIIPTPQYYLSPPNGRQAYIPLATYAPSHGTPVQSAPQNSQKVLISPTHWPSAILLVAFPTLVTGKPAFFSFPSFHGSSGARSDRESMSSPSILSFTSNDCFTEPLKKIHGRRKEPTTARIASLLARRNA